MAEIDMKQDPFFPSENEKASEAAVSEAWGRDPFSNPYTNGTPESGDKSSRYQGQQLLTGIIYNGDASIAIVGGETVRAGDKVGDRKIIWIRRNSVVLVNQSGGQEELFLENYSSRK